MFSCNLGRINKNATRSHPSIHQAIKPRPEHYNSMAFKECYGLLNANYVE